MLEGSEGIEEVGRECCRLNLDWYPSFTGWLVVGGIGTKANQSALALA